jgi:hypothetical protein
MLRPLLALLVALTSGGLCCSAARAQVADVVQANRDGDFLTTRIAGHRGFYPQRQWLVVDQDPDGLNCWDAQGRVVATLAYGAVVDSDPQGNDGEAILIVAERPWLRLIAHPFDLRKDLRPEALHLGLVSCKVRANAGYVAPLNPDTLDPVGAPGGSSQ